MEAPELHYCDITARTLIGFWPKLSRLNHCLSAALDTDPAHLRFPVNTHAHIHTYTQPTLGSHEYMHISKDKTSINGIQLNMVIHK